MEKLSTEEKAIAYDEAIERAEDLIDFCSDSELKTLEYVFPELKMSEDERIRKFLIKWIQDNYYHGTTEIPTKTLIAWLERQGEHLENYDEAEKEKTDFVGDGFIGCHADFLDFKEGNTYWLEYMGDDKYNVRSDNLLGKTYHITPCQLYTVFKKLTWLEKQGEQKPADEDMKEALRAEYEKGRADAFAQMQKEWSEEDENGLGDAIWCCKQAASIAKDENDMGNVWYAEHWLKSIKERIGG